MNIIYKTTVIKCISLFLFNMQLKSERGRGFTCMENAHITLNMFQNRCSFLANSSAFLLSFFHITKSHHLNFFLSWNFVSRTIFTFYDLIASDYTKGKGSGDKIIYFVWNHIILIRKCFFASAYFFSFGLKNFLKAGANASNISSNIENFRCWMKCWIHLRAFKI